MPNNELEHHSRVIDLMASMHSELRDRYATRATITDVAQLLLSVVLATTVFMDPRLVRLDPRVQQLVIGICATALFFLSLLVLRVGWKELAGRYTDSARTLARLKGDCRSLLGQGDHADSQQIAALCTECRRAIPELPPVPESDFPRLKAHHLRKVELSKMISQHSGASAWLLSLVLWLRANLGLCKNRTNKGSD